MKKTLYALIIVVIFAMCACVSAEERAYTEACAMLSEKQYDAAIAAFTTLGAYKDSQDKIMQANFGIACGIENSGEYESAIAAFEALGDYPGVQEHINACNYSWACSYFESKKYSACYDMFIALGDYQDSSERAAQVKELIEKDLIDSYAKKAITDVSKNTFYGTWVREKKEDFLTLMALDKCRVMSGLSLEKNLAEYPLLKWLYTDGELNLTDDAGNQKASYIVLMCSKDVMMLFDKINLCEVTFKRNNVHTLNSELDSGIRFGMQKSAVKRLETGTLKSSSGKHLQYSISVPDAKQNYTGTRTYYFNKKGKLYKTVITLDAMDFTTAEQNYAELSGFVNRNFFGASCSDLTNAERVTLGNGSYMEECAVTEGLTITLWATNSGGMLWVVYGDYADEASGN